MNSFLFFSSLTCLLLPPMETPAAASELPADLVAEILKRLPIKSLLRFMSVSHQWHLLIESPTFVSRLLRRSIAGDRSLLVRHRCRSTGDCLLSMLSGETLDLVSPVDVPPDMHSLNTDIVGSCNGVVCLSHDSASASDFGSSIFLWNPATRQHHTLPSCLIARESLEFPEKPCVVVHGFGYHRAADDYKVVRIAFDYPPHRPCFRAEVFALREGSWKEVNTLPCRVYHPGCVAVDGILYWVAHNCGSNDDAELILSFDLRVDVFRRICMPDLDFRPDGTCTKLAVYEESLCLIAYNFKGRAKSLDFWLMSGEAGKETWMKRLSIGPVIGIRRPLGFSRKGEILVEKTNGMLGIYEESCEEIRELPIKGFPYSLDIHSYIESMVPVKSRALPVNFSGQG